MKGTHLKTFFASILAFALTTAAYAGGPAWYGGNTGQVRTNIATSSGVVSNASAAWPRITSGWATSVSNQPPAAANVRLRLRITNTNSLAILVYTTSATNSVANYYIPQTNTFDLAYPLIDTSTEFYYSPVGGANGGTATNTAPVVNESFGLVQ